MGRKERRDARRRPQGAGGAVRSGYFPACDNRVKEGVR